MKTILNYNTSLAQLNELWSPQVVSETISHWFKLVKFSGEFEWHVHDDEKLLLVLEGSMRIEFKNKETVTLNTGDTYLIDKNLAHRPCASEVCGILLIERKADDNS